MSLRKVILFTALAATYLVKSTYAIMEVEDVTPEKAEVMFLCINTIVCEMGHEYEIKRIAAKPGEDLFEKGLGWLAECYNLDTSDMDEFWLTYEEKVCNYSMDYKRECTKELMINYANYYEEHCEENLTPYECTKAEETLTEVFLVIEEYTVSGDCNDPEEVMVGIAEEMEEKMKKNAQESADEFAGMAEDFPKPPSFG